MIDRQKGALISLRIGIAIVFLYASIAATLQPYNWIGYIPQAVRNIFPGQILLPIFSIYQFILGIWILMGWKTFYSAILAAFTLLGVILANIGQLDILFRDFAIFFSSIALFLMSKEK